MNSVQKTRRSRIWIALALVVGFIGLYLYFYQANPFPDGIADFVTSGMVVLAALTSAVVSALVARRYGKGTPHRLIWTHFSLALWGWAIGEAIWTYEYVTGGQEAAELSSADVLWVACYFLFIVSLYRQYVLIYRPERRVALSYVALSTAAVLIFSYLSGLWLIGSSPEADRLATFVNAFYAVGDSALAIGAFLIAFAFRDGALGRPWMGLLVFAFSDLLYAWLESSGLYAWSIEQGNILTTITDTSYLAAYLVIAFGCYLQLILLSYGPRLKYDQ